MTASTQESQVIAVRITVSGLVQGVHYRRWLQQEAVDREIIGWTRNNSDGTVEAHLQGAARQVDDLIRACRHGSSMARVDKLASAPADCDPDLKDFRIEPTV